MLLGIVLAVLVLATVAYAAYEIWQCASPMSRMRKIEKRTARQTRLEDREDRFYQPKKDLHTVDDGQGLVRLPEREPETVTSSHRTLGDGRV